MSPVKKTARNGLSRKQPLSGVGESTRGYDRTKKNSASQRVRLAIISSFQFVLDLSFPGYQTNTWSLSSSLFHQRKSFDRSSTVAPSGRPGSVDPEPQFRNWARWQHAALTPQYPNIGRTVLSRPSNRQTQPSLWTGSSIGPSD